MYRKFRDIKRRRSINQLAWRYYLANRNKKTDYAKNIWSRNYLWDYFLQSLPNSEVSKYYVPGDYYAFVIEPLLNRRYLSFAMEKNMYEKVFAGCKAAFPNTILRSMNQIFLDKDYRVVTDIEGHLSRIQEDVIVKPTVETGSGQGVRKYVYNGKTLIADARISFDIEELSGYYNGNFIVQSIVKQNSDIAKFHPCSLNTVRAFSYRSVQTNIVHVPTVVLRMGVNYSYLDTVSIGGIACGINSLGILNKHAFDVYGNSYRRHPTTNMEFDGFCVPAFENVISLIRKLADSIPHQRVAGWDFGIDEEANPVLIEVNVSTGSWLMQIASGRPLFGSLSDEVKDYIDSVY
jgi:hypothetical protein